MPVPTAPTSAVLGQPARSAEQFNALAARAQYALGGMPLFIGRQAVAQSIPTTAWTAVTLDAVDVDRDTGHNNPTYTSRYTAQTPGWYDLQGAGAFSNATTGRRIIRLQNSSSPIPGSSAGGPAIGSTQAVTLQTTAIFYIALGDFVELAMYQDSGVALGTSVQSPENSRLVARWVSA